MADRDPVGGQTEHAKVGHGFGDVVNLRAHPPDRDLLRRRDLTAYMRYGAIPWRRDDKGVIFAAADPAARKADSAGPDNVEPLRPPRFVRTTAHDIISAIEAAFGAEMLYAATEGLARNRPRFSAKTRLSPAQRNIAIAGAALLLLGAAAAPLGFAVTLNIALLAFFTIFISFRLYALIRNLRQSTAETKPPVADEDLPRFTIIAPLYDEAAVVAKLLEAFENLDYPADKLEIKLALEADDADTLAALGALALAENVHIVKTPPLHPRTKPKACNYALQFATGDIITIYDAEDRPDPGQLRRAAAHFAGAPANVACVQAPLSFYNADQNWLTLQFEVEYAVHFSLLTPALQAARWPIPLGGTSNHFRADVLRKLGAWDPYNVTEDADLGLRLAAEGYSCEMLASNTPEEATCTLKAWSHQRSRWIKGYMQTLMVNARAPAAQIRRMGGWSYLGALTFLGGSVLTAFSYVFIIALILLMAVFGGDGPMFALDHPLGFANLVLAIVGGGVALASSALVMKRNRIASGARALGVLLTAPLYRFWVTVAAVIAFADLIRRPWHWRKTAHGVFESVAPHTHEIPGPEHIPSSENGRGNIKEV